MQKWLAFDRNGDLPVGIYRATLTEVLEHFGTGTLQRRLIGQRLERIYTLAVSTGQVVRFAVFGSFVTATPHPKDIDIFLIMPDTFDAHQVRGEAAIIFDHLAVQNVEGASVFWIRRLAAMGGEHEALTHWQTKRDHTRRGIVEVINDDSERSGT